VVLVATTDYDPFFSLRRIYTDRSVNFLSARVPGDSADVVGWPDAVVGIPWGSSVPPSFSVSGWLIRVLEEARHSCPFFRLLLPRVVPAGYEIAGLSTRVFVFPPSCSSFLLAVPSSSTFSGLLVSSFENPRMCALWASTNFSDRVLPLFFLMILFVVFHPGLFSFLLVLICGLVPPRSADRTLFGLDTV